MLAEVLVCVCVRARARVCVRVCMCLHLNNVHLAYREGDWWRVVTREVETSFLCLVKWRAWVLAILTSRVMLRRC